MALLTSDSRAPARRSFLRANAPALALAGFVLLGTGLFLLGILASGVHATPFKEVGPPTVANGTARMTLALTGHFAIPPESVVEASYRFPLRAGDAYFLDCWDYIGLVEGRPLGPGTHVLRGQLQGEFRAPVEDLLHLPAAADPAAPSSYAASPYCPGFYAVFQWPASGDDGAANRPEAAAHFVVNELSQSPLSLVLPVLIALGGLAAVAGAFLWRQERGVLPPEQASASPDESLAETLLLLAERSEAWLARTRRYLVLAGVLGLFLWYPLLLPWAWSTGGHVSAADWAPWAFVAGAALLLLGLTGLWAREFLRLDRELAEWRRRLARLRRREEELMAELEP